MDQGISVFGLGFWKNTLIRKNQKAKKLTFWLISYCFFYFFLATFIPQALAQKQSSSQIQTLKSFKIKINNYGSWEQTTTISPNIITIDLTDSIISLQADHIAINEFAGFQNQFEITQSFGSGVTTKVFFTSSGYIFSLDSKMRVIVISKKDISPQLHSVRLEEISP